MPEEYKYCSAIDYASGKGILKVEVIKWYLWISIGLQILHDGTSFDEKTGIYYLDLNKRRAEMDLKPIEEYLKNWNAELRNIPK